MLSFSCGKTFLFSTGSQPSTLAGTIWVGKASSSLCSSLPPSPVTTSPIMSPIPAPPSPSEAPMVPPQSVSSGAKRRRVSSGYDAPASSYLHEFAENSKEKVHILAEFLKEMRTEHSQHMEHLNHCKQLHEQHHKEMCQQNNRIIQMHEMIMQLQQEHNRQMLDLQRQHTDVIRQCLTFIQSRSPP